MSMLVAAPVAALGQDDDIGAIARDGYVYGYPLVLMELTREISTAATGTGRFVHMLSGPTPPFRIVVAPNGDTRYSSAWVDLSAEPQILHVPASGGRYFVAQVLDAWTDVIADPTPRIPNSAPADYALVGPSWTAPFPPGVRVVRSSTNDVWILARTRARPDDAADAITAIQKQYTITPLRRLGDASYRPPTAVLRDPNVPTGPTPPSLVAAMSAATFFGRLADALGKNPPRSIDRPIVERLARIGVVPGKPFDSSAVDAGRRDARRRAPRGACGARPLRSAVRTARQRMAVDEEHGALRAGLPVPRVHRADAARREPARGRRLSGDERR